MKFRQLTIIISAFVLFQTIYSCCRDNEPTNINAKYDIEIEALNTSGFDDTTPVENEVDAEDLAFELSFPFIHTEWKMPFQIGISTAYACDDGGLNYIVEDRIAKIEIFQISDSGITNVSDSIKTINDRSLQEFVDYENQHSPDFRWVLLDVDESHILLGESSFLVEATLDSGAKISSQTSSFVII